MYSHGPLYFENRVRAHSFWATTGPVALRSFARHLVLKAVGVWLEDRVSTEGPAVDPLGRQGVA